jgi:hypothetical protein
LGLLGEKQVPNERAPGFLRKAEECREEAARALTADEKAAWLRMAEDWLLLSRAVAQQDGLAERTLTRVDGNIYPVHPKVVIRSDPNESGPEQGA